MLKVRVIPTLLWKDVGLVKGVGFDSWRRVGPIVPAVRVYTHRDVDELVVLDIMATRQRHGPDLDLVAEVADNATVPLTFGGGVQSAEDAERVLAAGADKVAINTAAYADPGLLGRCAHRFGSQAVVASIDVSRRFGEATCIADSGTSPMPYGAVDWARRVESSGAGEILLTSVDLDGTMSGYDVELISSVSSSVRIPVIASGGAGSPEDFRTAIDEGGASAVAAASIFHFTEVTPDSIKRHLQAHGIAVRRGLSLDRSP